MTEEEIYCNNSGLTKGNVFPNGSGNSNEDWDGVVKTFGISIGIFDIIFGSFGNLLTILAIWRNRRLRSTFHSFILSLCFVDFCTATFMMPFNVASYATGTWPFGVEDITCSIQAYVYYCCGYSSVVCLLVITVNRYVGILYADKYEDEFTPAKVKLTIAISLAFAPVVMGVVFFLGNDGKPGYGWIHEYSLCVIRTDKNNMVIRGYMMFTRILFQFIPLVIMVVMYSQIFYTVWKSGQIVAKMSLKSAEQTGNGSCNSSLDKEETTQHISNFPPNATLGEISCNSSMDLGAASHQNGNLSPKVLLDTRYSNSEIILPQIKTNNTLTTPQPNVSRAYHSEGSDASDDERIKPILKNSPPQTPPGSQQTMYLTPPLPRSHLGNRPTFTRNVLFANQNQNHNARHTRGFSIRSHFSRKSRGSTRSRSSMLDTIRRRQKMDKRLLRISVTICLVFSVMFYPSVFINLFPCSKYFNPNVHRSASIITWFNSCVNPMIYCFMNPKLRAEYKSLLQDFGRWIMRLIGKKTETQAPRTWDRSSSSFRQ